MQNQYETPELTLLGEADAVIMGSGIGGDDLPRQLAPDFEFEHD
ncbi:MAG TPA: hypothetical protein VF088_12545 [Pyrinomonadaceae bacterium]